MSHGTHPSYLLIFPNKENAEDQVFYITEKTRELLSFQHLEQPLLLQSPDPTTRRPAIRVFGFLKTFSGLVEPAPGNSDVRLLTKILFHALVHAAGSEDKFTSLWNFASSATEVLGVTAALVMCDDGRIRQLTIGTDGPPTFTEFEVPTLYRQGHVLVKSELSSQLVASHDRHVQAVEELFDPTKSSGFVMPHID